MCVEFTRLITFRGNDTIYYYKVDEVLRQALKLQITNKTGKPQSGTVTVSADNYESVITSLPEISEGRRVYTVFGPVVYPNVSSPFFTYRGGKHYPVLARVELKVSSQILAKNILIGRYRPWTVYVCQDVCSDFTWGYSEEETINLSTNLADTHLKMIERTEEEPLESQNRWNINQSMEVMWFLERKKDKVKKLFERERDDHVSISPIFNACLTGTMSTEQAIRSLYLARELERKFGIDLSVVEHIEVPTITWGMATIFAGSGIKYFVKGWLLFMAPFCLQRDDVPIFYWEGPDGSRVLTASDKGASLRSFYYQARFLFKPYREAVQDLHDWWIPHFENHSEYPYDAFILVGSHGDLVTESSKQVSRLVSNIIKYNSEPWEYPKIVNANWKHFFKHIDTFAEKYGITIPVLRGDFGSSWEEWPANLAAVFSKVRRGVNVFITAEKLLALASFLETDAYPINLDKLKAAELWMEHIAEHSWEGSRRRPIEKTEAFHRRQKWQEELNTNADEVTDSALELVSRHVSTEAETTLLVFNPLSWERTDLVSVEIKGTGPFRIKENDSGANLPNDVVNIGGKQVITFVAEKVPSLGYKTYTLVKAEAMGQQTSITINDNTLENKFYLVEVDKRTGGIQRIFNKKRNVELVDIKSKYKLNQYVYLSEGKEYTPLVADISMGPRGKVSGCLIVESSTLRSKIKTTITLYSNLDRIDITNELEKTPSSELQEEHFVFPFNVPNHVYHYEATAAIIKPGLTQYGGEQLRGSGQSSHACQSFVDVANDSYGVTLAQVQSYLVQFGHRTTLEMPMFPDPSNSTIWSLIMFNKYNLEMLDDQGGISNFIFRYSIKGHDRPFKASREVHFGWERNNELLMKVLNPHQRGELPSKSYSFLSCEPENVVVTALKVAEEGLGNGLIIRLWETDGKVTEASLDVSSISPVSAIRTDILERDQESLQISDGIVSVPISARGISTIRLNGS